MSRIFKLSYAALALSLVAGCAQELPPRSFVQPNIIKKADLDGTWYYLQTVTDAPPTSSFMFIGNSSELMKIKFDIQENYIYARRAYEQIQGSEDAYTQDPAKYAGQPVAAWRISSQFDIIRDYNATTGEESNKIIESTERPWNEREFIRVDWSENLVTDYVGLGINFFFADGATVEPVSYWESDPTKPDALHLERADKTDPEFSPGEANYLDITNKWVVSPTNTTLSYTENGVEQTFSVPSCFLAYMVDDCASQVVKVRHAFAKISPKHDYQPRNWDGKQMNLFGIWDVGLNRLTYNRQYGITNSGFVRHAARFNLWKKSYQDDGVTPIPYAQRELRTIPYYAESSLEPFPPELFDVGANVIKQWNDAVSVAVKDVTGTMPTTPVFVWCHNPVKMTDDSMGPADDAACIANIKPELDAKGNIVKGADGKPVYHARQGDPRRSNIFWVNQEQNAGPLGYGPPLFDVETGETISGQAYIYGAALDTYAARSRDLVLLVTGKLDPQNYVDGVNVQSWVSANRAGVPNEPTYTPQQIKTNAGAMDFSWAKNLAPETPLDFSNLGQFITSLQRREDAIYKSGIFGNSNADLSQVRRDALKGTTLEAAMVTPDVMAMGGLSAASDWTSLDDAEKSRVSPLRSSVVRQAINDRLDKMRVFGYDFTDFTDEGIVQRALRLANDPNIPNMDPEAIRQQLRKDIFLAVTLHEVGHNMGLRHNFRASWDSMNYMPQYWQLRSQGATAGMDQKYAGIDLKTGKVLTANYNGGSLCTNAPRAGKMRPRYVDCPGGATSVAEVMGGIREYQYSSIMDYGAEFNSDLQGLGKYDKAAMKFSYAGDGYVEVFTDVKSDQATQDAFESLEWAQTAFGFPSPLTLNGLVGNNLSSINYYSYPDLFNSGINGLEMREDVPYSDISAGGTFGLLLADSMGRPIVPYYFCSDEFVGNLTCQRFDSGADAYEQARDIISRYENFYLLNDFKRDRYTFHTSLAYKDRIAGRYFDMLREQLTWYALLRSDFTQQVPSGSNFYSSEDGWGSFTQAVTEGFDLLGRVLTKPDAGGFGYVDASKSTDYPFGYWKQIADDTNPAAYQGQNAKIVGMLDGKWSTTTWDFTNCGYYWADECQTRIGYFIDKTVALDVLSQSQAYFTGRDTSTDVRKYAIGYILPFKNQIQEKFGALFAGDYQSLAPYFDANGNVVEPRWTVNDDGRVNGTPDPTRAAGLIDPATGFTTQLYAGIYGLSAFPTTFDHSFIENTKIFVVGNGEAPVPDSQLLAGVAAGVATPGPLATNDPAHVVANDPTATGKEWFVWYNSNTGKVYAAHSVPRVGDGDLGGSTNPYRQDIGVRMLETARSIAATGNTQSLNLYLQNLELMRALHNSFGYGTYKTDAEPLY